MTVRLPVGRRTPDDDRLLQELTCRRCATTVLVGKNSPAHTSIQWLADAASCTELAGQRAGERSSSCTALRESIEDAVRDGRLEVLSGE